jgi:hypothetical protein
MGEVERVRAELAAHRARVCKALCDSADPLLREIGEQLGRGVIEPRDLLAEPTYRDVVDEGLTRFAHFGTDTSPAGRQGQKTTPDISMPTAPG